jgi:hypothetical protein
MWKTTVLLAALMSMSVPVLGDPLQSAQPVTSPVTKPASGQSKDWSEVTGFSHGMSQPPSSSAPPAGRAPPVSTVQQNLLVPPANNKSQGTPPPPKPKPKRKTN